MKNLYALSFALIFCFPVQAGNWDLFPLGQKTVYVDSTQALPRTEQHVVDSVRITGDVRTLYFDRSSMDGSYYGCETIGGTTQQWAFNSYTIDSLVQFSDTVYFLSTFSTTPFFFLPHATVGQSWTVVSTWPGNGYDAITITCSTVGVQTFLGLTDSVKVFSLTPNGSSLGQAPISDHQFVLSKTYGLLAYVPFDQFLYHPANSQFQSREMAGLEIGAITAGYQRPLVSDYFHLAPGDLRSWELHFLPAWIVDPETLEYMEDSITNVVASIDSVVYTFDRTFYHADGAITYHIGLKERYWLPELMAMLEAPGYGIAFGPGLANTSMGLAISEADLPLVWTAPAHEWFFEPLLLATVERLSLFNGGALLNTNDCAYTEATDMASEVDIDNWAGVTRLKFSNMNETTQTLLGFRINGIVKGLMTIGIDQPRRMGRTALSIQPNPARESITFQGLPPGSTGQFTIYDGLGREAMHGTLPTAALSVEGLLPGVYVVQVRFSDRTAMARFVKE